MAKAWISPEAKTSRAWIRGWLVAQMAHGSKYSFSQWIPPNFGGGVFEGKIQFQLQDSSNLKMFTIDLKMKKVGGNWIVENHTIKNKET